MGSLARLPQPEQPVRSATSNFYREKAETWAVSSGDRNLGSLAPGLVSIAPGPWIGFRVLRPLLLKPPLLGSVAGHFLLGGWALRRQRPWPPPAESAGDQGGSWWKPRLYSLVQQEQLLMTFRKKLMMRNASWHFSSSRQQPCEHSTEQRAGVGGARN